MTVVPQQSANEHGGRLLRSIDHAMEVVGEDGSIGQVRRVLPEWHGATPTHVVVEAEKAELVIVPLGTAKEITPERITVRLRRRHLLREAPAFRGRDDLDVIRVRVVDGVAELHGNARSLLRALQIEQIAQKVSGVTEIRNELIVDDDVARTATTALRHAPDLQLDQSSVSVELGMVHVRARSATSVDCALALLALRPIIGVRGVRIDLELRPAADAEHDLPRRVTLQWWRPATVNARGV